MVAKRPNGLPLTAPTDGAPVVGGKSGKLKKSLKKQHYFGTTVLITYLESSCADKKLES